MYNDCLLTFVYNIVQNTDIRDQNKWTDTVWARFLLAEFVCTISINGFEGINEQVAYLTHLI